MDIKNKILNDLAETKANWMHKTDCEKLNAIRIQIVELSNANYRNEVTTEDNIAVLDVLNEMMKLYMNCED